MATPARPFSSIAPPAAGEAAAPEQRRAEQIDLHVSPPAERHPASAPPARADVVVLGGGPAGLAAAWDLLAAGRRVVIVELAPAPGGLCRTHERRGCFFDQGGHRFITANRRLYERVADLLGGDLRLRERQSVIRIGEREYRYPLDLGEVLRGEGIAGIARILASYAASRSGRLLRRAARPGRDGETLESWVRGRFGGAIFDRFFRDYTLKLWGIGAGEISGDWAGQRISQIRLGDVVRNALRNALGGDRSPPRTFARRYAYPRRGIGQIFSTLAARLERDGAALLLESRATRIDRGRPLTVEVTGPEGTASIACDHIASTIPLPELAALLDPPAGVAAAAGRLTFRSLRFVNLLLEGPHVSPRTWIYVPEKRYPMTRIQFPAARSPENCPPGMTSIQLEIPCGFGDPAWSAPHEELLERCLAALAELGLDVRARLTDSFTTRARHAYPVYRRGYREARDEVLAWIRGVPGVETCGRQGRFDYIFFDRAMEDGFAAAMRIAGAPPGSEEPDALPEPGCELLPIEARSIT